ncbi:MAG: hypothetical protein LBD35_00810 [Prevotellaceae bacterium]|jgi:hypothetical protein|nr:hypothetical protein [Prevotellaceae bacterium]
MKRRVRLTKNVIAAAIMAIALCSCESCKSEEDLGTEAGHEACECAKKNSLSKCQEIIKEKYDTHANQKFVDAFNAVAGPCGFKMTLITK